MIEGDDFKLEYLPEHSKFDLYLLKTINAKNADKKREEFVLAAYGVSEESALKRIIRYRLNKKEKTFTFEEYLSEFKKLFEEIKGVM